MSSPGSERVEPSNSMISPDGIPVSEDILQALTHFPESFGFTHYSYLVHEWPLGYQPPPSLTNLPLSWIKAYEDVDALNGDPVHALGRALKAPQVSIAWSIDSFRSDLSSTTLRLIRMADEHGFKGGAVIILRGPYSAYSTLSLLTLKSDNNPVACWERHRSEIEALAFELHSAITRSCVQPDSSTLTIRQTQVLEACARGLTARETASLLGATEASIKFHLKEAYMALKATNAANAVAIALSAGLIRLFPQAGTYIDTPAGFVFLPPKSQKRTRLIT